MKQPLLLDTCAAIFLVKKQLNPSAQEAVKDAGRNLVAVYVSPITAWELGMLVSRGRLAINMSPEAWFTRLILGGLQLAELSPEILISSSFLPNSNLRDPSDRIIAATARTHGYRLVTRDRPLLEYASQGHLSALAC
jgi:PIN domain nuclease of toxin-antitoxin system